MRFFFRSKQFKIISSAVVLLIILSIICSAIGGVIAPQANIIGTVTAPFRSVATAISNTISDTITAYFNGNELILKNAELEKEVGSLRKQLADYEKISAENDFYKNYLEIKNANPDFKFAGATLISRDKEDPYKSFVINKGSSSGISENDPVITNDGLVGYISEVGLTTSKVTTILSSDITIGALDNRTNDSGVISGTLELSPEGETKFFNLSRSCNIAIGDYVVTSGEGIFPSGLLIGKINSIGSDKYNTSIYASIEPFVNIDGIRDIMVITEFEGQGGLLPQSGE